MASCFAVPWRNPAIDRYLSTERTATIYEHVVIADYISMIELPAFVAAGPKGPLILLPAFCPIHNIAYPSGIAVGGRTIGMQTHNCQTSCPIDPSHYGFIPDGTWDITADVFGIAESLSLEQLSQLRPLLASAVREPKLSNEALISSIGEQSPLLASWITSISKFASNPAILTAFLMMIFGLVSWFYSHRSDEYQQRGALASERAAAAAERQAAAAEKQTELMNTKSPPANESLACEEKTNGDDPK